MAQFRLRSADWDVLFSLAPVSTSLATFGNLWSSWHCNPGAHRVFHLKNNHLLELLANVLFQSLIKMCFVRWCSTSVISLCRKEEGKEKGRRDIFQCETVAWFRQEWLVQREAGYGMSADPVCLATLSQGIIYVGVRQLVRILHWWKA